MLRAYNVSWLRYDCSETNAVCSAPPEDEQVCSKHVEALDSQQTE
jgi:predicted nucleic acid-binding Zn ribbon protein